jgi:HK97 family phage major capsid protein
MATQRSLRQLAEFYPDLTINLSDDELRALDNDRVRQFSKTLGSPTHSVTSDPGSTFVQSEGFKRIQRPETRGQQWTSGPVEVAYQMKGTLLEGAGAPGSGTGGGLLPVPQVVPGVVTKLDRAMVLEDLLLAGQATTNTVRYVVEGTATSGAAGVAEGGTKPESTLAFSTIAEPVKKTATSIVVSDELLEDGPAVQSFVNNELIRFVNLEVERQLLRGAAGGNEVQGLLSSRGVPVYTAGTALGNIAEQLFKARNSMRGSAFLEPDWFVLHPSDYEKLRLLKDNSGQLYFGGPNAGSYGAGQSAAASPQIVGPPDVLWGKPAYVSPIIGAGTALVGTRAGAQVWSKGGPSVEATNSHGSVRNRSGRHEVRAENSLDGFPAERLR